MQSRNAFALLACLLAGCGQDKTPVVCPDDGDPLGPVCVERVKTADTFELVTLEQGFLPGSDRVTKYMAPADDDPELLPVLFQNVNRYLYHIEFLRRVFPDRFPALDQQSYLDLILKRDTRSYYAGNFVRIQSDGETLYGFTVYTAASSDELLEADEVRALYESLDAIFDAGDLVYTFDPTDAMARQKAGTWTDPGFPVYFY